jgi:hypothetical protein
MKDSVEVDIHGYIAPKRCRIWIKKSDISAVAEHLEDNYTVVYLANNTIHVQGSYDEVMRKLGL